MNWINKFSNSVELSQELKKKLELELVSANLKNGTFFICFTVLLQLANILFITIFRTYKINIFPEKMYLALYLFFLIFCCCHLVVIYYVKRDIVKNKVLIEILSIIFLIVKLFWATTISMLDLNNNENVSIYFYTMIALSVALYIKPKIFIPVILVNYFYLLFFYIVFQKAQSNYAGNIFNATIVLCIAAIISGFRYYERIYSFLQKQTIIKQNKLIKDRNAELKKLAVTDTLSGLYNRRLLDTALSDKWNECFNNQTNFGFVMLDIDNFKQVNDTFGHLAGDACISTSGNVIRECTEGTEAMAFRYGGEEFAIIISNCSKKQIQNLCNQIRLKLERCPIICQEEGIVLYITASIGYCCEVPHDNSNCFEFVSMADMGLRTAKQKGKNQVQRCKWDKNKNVMYEQ